MNCDSVIREEIPPDVWKRMGAQLTKTGEEKLKAMKQKSPSKTAEQIKKPTVILPSQYRKVNYTKTKIYSTILPKQLLYFCIKNKIYRVCLSRFFVI